MKTNLLADIALMPSLEVEYLINEQWSVAAHGAVAWWSKDAAHKYYQISTIYPEARWWFKTKEPWHGHYLGLFAGGTWYDLENGGRGYQGEGGFVGLSYGYMFPITKCLSFEAGLGLGISLYQVQGISANAVWWRHPLCVSADIGAQLVRPPQSQVRICVEIS